MLTPSYLSSAAEPMVNIWSSIENDILSDIVRRLLKTDYLTTTASWQIRKAKEIGMSRNKIAQAIAAGSKKSRKAIDAMISEACDATLTFDTAQYTKAGLDVSGIGKSDAIQRIEAAGSKQTWAAMKNFTKTTANTATKAFENSLDTVWLQVQSGAYSLDQAIGRAISDLGKRGISQIAYPGGHKDQLDVAVRRAMVTGINQTAAKAQLQSAEEMGSDLVEVTAHADARPSHAEWQGQIYSLSGKSKKYKPFVQSTGYGSGDGLCGWNCRHNFFPYLEGVSSPTFNEDYDAMRGKTNAQAYEESQQQRSLERSVRETRRECTVLDTARKAASSPAQKADYESKFAASAAKLKMRESKLKTFCKETGRTQEVDRVSVSGYNHSVSSKATAVAKLEEKRSAAKDAIRTLVGKSHTVHIPSQFVDTSGLTYDAVHVNAERQRGITAEEAKSFVEHAVVSVRVWGSYERYFSEKGAAYVNLGTSTIRTAFRYEDYTDINRKILEELKKHGI